MTCNGLHRPLRLQLAADGRIDADAAVLATGNQPPAAPCPVPASHRYIRDPWMPGALDRVGDGSPVVVLGSGLTMLDVAISLTGAHPDTVVHAVSRHALLPREHRCPPGRALQPPALQPADLSPVDLPGLIRRVQVAAAEFPDGWQAVVDALRPYVPGLWQRLSLPDKRLFLRHVARYWEVHRHRVPPATARRIDELRSTGRLLGTTRPRRRGQRHVDGPVRPDRTGRAGSRGGGRLADQRHRACRGRHRHHGPAAARPARQRTGPAGLAPARHRG